MTDPVTVLALVAAVGVVAQVVTARTKIPAIVLLLASGLVLGPGLGLLDPDGVYGDLLFPAASAAVAFLLFDGGLSLRFRELGDERLVLARLLTVGVLVAWAVSAAAAVVAGLPLGVAAIFGAIMTVTGPTVVIPLLREARLRPRITKILRWEGILIDPIGAVLAVVTFEAVVEGHGQTPDAIRAVAATVGAGTVVGLVVAGLIVFALSRHLIKDRLEVPAIMAGVLVAVALANSIFDEAGLVAATGMGVLLGNQRRVEIRRIVGFHESLAIVLVGVVFVLLAARVEARTLASEAAAATFVLLVLVLVARPASVWASTIGSRLSAKERAYLAGMAPRGVVAASVSALFSLRLEELGVPGGVSLAALAFIVVAGTVVVYGGAARPLARWLQVAAPEPTGVVLVGGEPWLLQVGTALSEAEVPVLVLTGDDDERRAAAAAGLLTHTGPLRADAVSESLEAVGARMALAGSRREELNGLAPELVVDFVGRANIYLLDNSGETNGRRAFGGRVSAEELSARVANGDRFEVRPAAASSDDRSSTPLFYVSPAGVPSMLD
ncbi:MAG: cation:proton antiporter, partial [Actinobacteria bacterium]|nr:cation:proton antiporter [Actinomycetota bacterium]